jgi:hypothetical protein
MVKSLNVEGRSRIAPQSEIREAPCELIAHFSNEYSYRLVAAGQTSGHELAIHKERRGVLFNYNGEMMPAI